VRDFWRGRQGLIGEFATRFAGSSMCAGQIWHAEIDSADPAAVAGRGECGAGEGVTVGPRSIVVLRGSA
jgi:hypothetical protein